MEKITTIKISPETKSRLDHLKEHKKESYEEVLKKALNILNISRRSPMLGAKILRDIDRGKKRENLIANPEKISGRKQISSRTSPIQRMQMNLKSIQRSAA